jgi:hypothetical protein
MDRREMPAHLSLRVSGFLVVKRDLCMNREVCRESPILCRETACVGDKPTEAMKMRERLGERAHLPEVNNRCQSLRIKKHLDNTCLNILIIRCNVTARSTRIPARVGMRLAARATRDRNNR